MDSRENTQAPPDKKQDFVSRIKTLLEDPEVPAVVKDHFRRELKDPHQQKEYQFYEGAD